MPNVGDRKDPYSTFNFSVEIDGIIAAGFTDVSGLTISTEVHKFKEGGVNDFEHKLPKSTTYTDITLKRGITDFDLWNWYQDVIYGTIERKNGTIYVFDNSKKQVDWWYFFEAFPIKWEGPIFNASSGTVASETLVLAHHGLF